VLKSPPQLGPPAEHPASRATPATGAVGPSRSSGRFWLAVAIGAVVSTPFCWLLSFAALLPFFIGLFFFALFGLVIGAVVYRLAHRKRPYPSRTVVIGTTLLVAFVWSASVLKESWDLPGDMAVKAAGLTRDLRGRSVDEFRQAVADEVRGFIQDRYPPGGVIGYVRWALTSGRIDKGVLPSVEARLALNQTRYLFAIRMALSIGLLAFGIASQTWPMRRPTRIPDEIRESEISDLRF
jgi:hypothetical protein